MIVTTRKPGAYWARWEPEEDYTIVLLTQDGQWFFGGKQAPVPPTTVGPFINESNIVVISRATKA